MAHSLKKFIEIEAPCPGVVWRLGEVNRRPLREGDFLKEGEEILNLEFMKIQIPILAPFDCKIIKILVKEGKHVNQGDVLIILEPVCRE